MNSKIVFVSIIVFLAYLTSGEGMSLRGLGIDPRCRCVETESRRIGKYIESVEIFPPTSHCKDTEIIATLKITKQEICLNPAAEWVIKVIEKMIVKKQT
ncbi:interleukin-8-like [Myxocyprinus asiaticus]|uniref:interleukin-8-like n=1 Tax=Myxocyprinus asiaticus TaxID=70543 RepID=UPI0022217E4B|nr:interleukin-8-like [Myxocyprinus asiaticus]